MCVYSFTGQRIRSKHFGLVLLLLLLLLLLKIRTAIDDIEAGFVIGSGQQQVA